MSKRQTNPPASQVTTHNRFAIRETGVAMDTTTEVNTQPTQKNPPPPPIFIDDVIDIQSMTKTIQKEIGKDEYKLRISNNSLKVLPANPDAYRKLTKLLKKVRTTSCKERNSTMQKVPKVRPHAEILQS